MEKLFTTLMHAVEGTPAIAIGASFVWGILSILLSPCHLSSIPLIVAFVNGQGRTSTRRAFVLASLFSVGILITIAAIGIITAAAGRMFGDLGGYGNYLVALIFFVVGLHLLGVIPIPWSGPGQPMFQRKGLLAAFVLGLIFGIALGPCTFTFMAPVLAATFRVGAERPVYAASLLASYGIGHCSVIILAGVSAELVQRYMNWNEKSRATTIIKRLCGFALILCGLYLILIAR